MDTVAWFQTTRGSSMHDFYYFKVPMTPKFLLHDVKEYVNL